QSGEGRVEAYRRRRADGAHRHEGPVALPEREARGAERARADPASGVRQPERQDPLPQGRLRALLRRGRGDDGPRPSRGHRATRNGHRAGSGALSPRRQVPAGALRVHFHIGPALSRLRLPLGPTFVSAVLHVVLLAVVIFGASMWSDSRSKPVYVVLAPATAAIGSPKGVTMPPPPRVEEPPAPKPAPPAELPRRETARELPSRELPARDLPPSRDSIGLPDRS